MKYGVDLEQKKVQNYCEFNNNKCTIKMSIKHKRFKALFN